MSELMLVNPRRKRRRSRRKMSALQRQYFGGGRKRRRRRSRVSLLQSNPVHRKRSRRRSHSRRRRVTRLRRNPIRLNASGFLNGTLIPAGIGAVGALGVDLAMGYSAPYLPSILQTGIGNAAARIAGAVGVGYLAGKVGGRKFGEEATAGAIIVTLYSLIKPMVAGAVPGLPLAGLGYNMGWISPGMQVDGLNMYVGSDNAYSGTMHGLSGLNMYVENEGDYIRQE